MELCSMFCASLYERGTWGRMDTCTCSVQFLCCSLETTTILLIDYSPIQNKKCKPWGENEHMNNSTQTALLFKLLVKRP